MQHREEAIRGRAAAAIAVEEELRPLESCELYGLEAVGVVGGADRADAHRAVIRERGNRPVCERRLASALIEQRERVRVGKVAGRYGGRALVSRNLLHRLEDEVVREARN